MLTDTAVRTAKPKEKDYALADGLGLYLYIRKEGSKYWHFRYTIKGTRKRISLGVYPAVSLKDARTRRDEARVLIAKGIDPLAEREAEASQDETFSSVATRWLDRYARQMTPGRKGRAELASRYLDKDILPALGKMPIQQVTKADILKLIRSIEARGAFHVASKVRTWVSKIMRHAVGEGLMDSDPSAGLADVVQPKPPVRHNAHLELDELPAFISTLRTKDNRIHRAIWLLLLTGVRTGELRQARREHFDLATSTWAIPAATVKQLRQKARTERIPDYLIPLPRQAVQIVASLISDYPGNDLLIPGEHDPQKTISENTLNRAIKRLGFDGRLTGHGIRATISTALHSLDYRSEWIEAQLGHADPNRIRGTYNHASYVEQRRAMMQSWADLLWSMSQSSANP